MAAEVLQSFGTLQLELEQARTSLKDVDEHIKKLIGRDPSENNQIRPGAKRLGNHGDEPRGRARGHNNSSFVNNRNKQNYENDEPTSKKRNLDSSVFKRLSDRPKQFDDDTKDGPGKNQLISKVIVTPKEVPSRQDVLAAQGADEKSKARNRRMFGALLGTLQKFRQEETKLKSKEEKRAQVEKKLEDQQIREREELKKERQDLFLNRKKKQAEIRMIELKMTRMKEHAEWEEKQKPLMHFIQTKTKPHIYYLPKILNEQNKALLETNRQNIEKLIDRKRQDVYEELNTIEQRMKRNFNGNKQSGTSDKPDEEASADHDESLTIDDQEHDHEQDHEMEIEPEVITKQEEKDSQEISTNNLPDNSQTHDESHNAETKEVSTEKMEVIDDNEIKPIETNAEYEEPKVNQEENTENIEIINTEETTIAD